MAEAPGVFHAVALLVLLVHAPASSASAVETACADADPAARWARLGLADPECPAGQLLPLVPQPPSVPVPAPGTQEGCLVDASRWTEPLRDVASGCVSLEMDVSSLLYLRCGPDDPDAPCCPDEDACCGTEGGGATDLVCEIVRAGGSSVSRIRQRVGQEGDDPWCLDVGQGPDDGIVLRYDPEHACTDHAPEGSDEDRLVGLP